MVFQVKPKISMVESLEVFLENVGLSTRDLIVTNEHIFAPFVDEKSLPPCSLLYQERFGKGEPSDEMVDGIINSIKGKEYDRIIAIGGGTVIDVSKLLVFGEEMSCEEIFAAGESAVKKRKLIAIPTTCGTGSEVTMISVASFIKKNTKSGLAVPSLFPDEAVLIPSLLASQPYEVFAASAIDALIHAVESHVSPKANTFSDAIGAAAMFLIIKGFQDIVKLGERKLPDVNTLARFAEGSTLAGIAFGNVGVGAVHALSYPVGAAYHVPHGKSNYMFFEAVFNAYKKNGADLSKLDNTLSKILDTQDVWGELSKIMSFLLDLESLSSLGATEKDCRDMAASVIKNQQRLLVNNPIPLTEDDIFDIYMKCL